VLLLITSDYTEIDEELNNMMILIFGASGFGNTTLGKKLFKKTVW